MEPKGLECAQHYSISGDSAARAAEINALGDDSELAMVLAAWPMLSVEARAEIVRLVEAAKEG